MNTKVLTLNDGQKEIVATATNTFNAAQERLQLVLATICAGEGIQKAKVVSIEDNKLTLEVLDDN